MRRCGNGVLILAVSPQGFDIKVVFDRDGYLIMLDQAMLEVKQSARALDIVEKALTGDIRLQVTSRNGKPWQWTVEHRNADDLWIVEAQTGYVSLKFWQQNSSTTLINDAGMQFQLPRDGFAGRPTNDPPSAWSQ